jgi:hypothetical protein
MREIRRDIIKPNTRNISLKTLYTRYIPATVEKVPSKPKISPKPPKRRKGKNNLMQLPEKRTAFCFTVFHISKIVLIMTFFYLMHISESERFVFFVSSAIPV